MAEPENGNELRVDEVIELHLVWNKTTGDFNMTGCVNVAPLALGLLDYARVALSERYTLPVRGEQPRIVRGVPVGPRII